MRIVEELASEAVFDHAAQKENVRSFREMLINYYSNTEYIRTPQQIRRDQWIIHERVRCQAWMIIPIAVLSQFCLGSLYAWSIFNKPIDKYLYGDLEANRAQITFYISLGMLGASGAAFGPWIESHSPRMCATIASVLFFAGHCTAALGLSCKEIGILYFGYGFIGGIAMGVGYVTTIDAVIQWYPSSRGFASGLAVSGFGSGAVAFSNLNAELLRVFTIPQTFFILGLINLVIMFSCAMFMRPPPPDYNLPGVAVDMVENSIADMHYPQHRNIQQTIKGKSATIGGQTITVGSNSGDPVLIITLSQALSSRDFWFLWVAFFVNLVFGVVIISNLASMSTNMFGSNLPAPVTTIVTIEGAFNASGRLMMGWASDWAGRRRTFLFVISLQIAIVTCLIFIIPKQTFWPFVVLVWLATLCYGGGVGVIAATLADMFGAPNMSACHGVILTGWSVAAIGGGVTYTSVISALTDSKKYTLSDPFVYVVNQYWILSLLICGWIILLFVRITPRERMYPRVHGQLFCHMLGGFMFRLVRGTQQHGLHDYEFLSAAPQSNVESTPMDVPGIEGRLSECDGSIISGIERLETNTANSRALAGQAQPNGDMQVFASNGVQDSSTLSTYTHEEASLNIKQQSPEAFNYVSDNRKSAYPNGADPRGSCVQLMCETPPTRRCIRLFSRWRLEHVSKEEVATVWRMYLSCALLASSNKD
ncbi:hypothetical protein LPJ73_000649 [Coemansia sp. RSA 2703]|nr:hypothetical protein LPJ73_000649 [Coemansia sp. RSA 2703]KAJ2371366.1 hypothetical protein IW150_004625 [Coemansia sp. RSA 2607]KAJ2397309.1 hypothetical protein GGI05_000705 [Coemansia sp. RSA 2603]